MTLFVSPISSWIRLTACQWRICCDASMAVKEKCGFSKRVLARYNPEVAPATLEAADSWAGAAWVTTGAWCRRCGCHKAPRRQDSVQSGEVLREEFEIAFQQRGDCPPTRRLPYEDSHLQLARARERAHAKTSGHDQCLRCCLPLSVWTSSSVN